MTWMNVLGGTPPPAFPTGMGYSDYYSLSGEPPGEATSVDVGSVEVTTVGIGQGQKRGQATVVVVDDLGGIVAGATVTGEFTGTFTEQPEPEITDATGTAVITTSESAKGKVSVTFCVTSIGHPTLTDWTGEVCASD